MQRSHVTSEPHREEETAWKTKAGEDWAQTHHGCLYYWKVGDGFNGIKGSNLLPIVIELSHCLFVNVQSSFVVQANNGGCYQGSCS